MRWIKRLVTNPDQAHQHAVNSAERTRDFVRNVQTGLGTILGATLRYCLPKEVVKAIRLQLT